MAPFENQPTERDKHEGGKELGRKQGGEMAMSLYPRCTERG
jgi:hypothetical protein